MLVGAEIGADLELRVIGQPAGHIFDRAANRVAAVEGSLRAAQDLDALDVVNVQDRRLRPVEINVVEINADTLLETRDWVLLADTADEGGQGGIGAARDLQGDVRSRFADVGNVNGTLAAELFAGKGGHRDWNIQQRFVSPASRDDNIRVAGVRSFRLRLLVRGNRRTGCRILLRKSRRGISERRGRGEQNGSSRNDSHCMKPPPQRIHDRLRQSRRALY